MIKLKNILIEKDEKSDSENPDKILVKNKESGKSYYIGKDSFDASKHEKSESSEKKKKEEPTEKKDTAKDTGGGDPISAAFGQIDKKEKEKKEKEDKEKEAKLPPHKKLEKQIGSFVFLDNKERDEIADDSKNFRPDLQKKLVEFEFTSFFRNYDELLNDLSRQYASKDNEGSKQTMKEMKKVAKRMQAIAIAKHAVLSPKENDPKTISSAKFYHSSNNVVNEILRNGNTILTNDQIEKIQQELDDNPHLLSVKSNIGSLSKYDRTTLRSMKAINALDEHFQSEGSRLEYDAVVYRGIKKSVLEKFVEAGDWVDNGFVSTTLNPIIAEDFTDRALVSSESNRIERTPIFKINLKRGDRVLMLPCSEDEFCIESEITLPRGCRFTITGKDEEKNIYEVSVEFPNA